MQRNDAVGSVQTLIIYARYNLIPPARLWPSCRYDAQGRRPKMSDTDRGQLLLAYQIIEKGFSPRSRLLVNKAHVGIGDVVWQKPRIDNITRECGIILAKKKRKRMSCVCLPANLTLLRSCCSKVSFFVPAIIPPRSTLRRLVCDLPLVSLSKPTH